MIIVERLPLFIVMISSAFISALIALRAYRARRNVARASAFSMMALSGTFWMACAALDTFSTDLVWKEFFWKLIPFFILCTLTGLFFFSFEFSLRLKSIPKSIVVPVFVGVGLVTILALTNPLHHQMWVAALKNGIYVQVMGNFFPIQLAVTYLLTFSSLGLLVRAYFLSSGLLRRQTVLLLVGISIPIFFSIAVDLVGWDPLVNVDEPALSIIFTVVLFAWATLEFNSFFLLPVASDVIIQNMQDGVLVTDIEGLVIFSNRAARQMLARKENSMQGKHLGEILDDWLPEAGSAWNDKKAEAQLVRGEEKSEYFLFRTSPILGTSQELIGFLLRLSNNTEQKNYEKRLTELAICDPLTGSYNRRYFYEMVHNYFHQMMRSSKPLTILMIDLDHFKSINDNFGHAKGDLALQKVAAVCRSQVRSQDIFSRHGGEEFILAMPETSLLDGMAVAERLRKSIDNLKAELDGIPITASIGVVEASGEQDLTLDSLINRADEALYLSKNSGRNRVTAWKNV